MTFEDNIEAWPEPADGETLLDEIKSVIRRHCVLPDFAADVIAIWILHTWVFETADHSAILALVSPEKRCGKTTAFNVIHALVRKPVSAANVSTAAVYRLIEQYQPTLMIDEADTFIEASDELRGVLNAGNSRQGAQIIRMGGTRFDQFESFNPYCPKCIAMIGRLPDTLEDRSVTIELRRKTKEESVERFHSRTAEALEPMRRKLKRWADDLDTDRLDNDPNLPEQLNDRAQDNCRHLVSIADYVGGHWPMTVRHALAALHASQSDDGPGVMLLRDIKAIFIDWSSTSIPSSELIEQLWKYSPEWSEYRGRAISAKGVARLLKPFGIRAVRDRRGSLYIRGDFEDAWKRYL